MITDPAVLATLPAEELHAGYAEVVKTALIAGAGLWERVLALAPLERALEDDLKGLAAVVEDCARTKLAVVAADERDTGMRASLNLGHTVAHALESATGYGAFRHGEAVAIGLLAALRVSEHELGLDPAVRERVRDLLAANGLQVTFEGPPTDELLGHMDRDKKRSGARRNLVLLRAPGDVDDRRRGARRRCSWPRSTSCARDAARATASRCCTGSTSSMLGKRDAAALRNADAGRARGAHPPLGARAGARDELLPHQLRGRVHRAPASGAAGRPTG